MDCGVKTSRGFSLCCLCAVLVCGATSVEAALVNNIQLNYLFQDLNSSFNLVSGTVFYHNPNNDSGAGNPTAFFQPQDALGSAHFSASAAGTPIQQVLKTENGDYLFEGTVHFTPMQLLPGGDNSAGGTLSGDFDASNAILTLTGSLWQGGLGTPRPSAGSSNFLIENGLVLEAASDSDVLVLEEVGAQIVTGDPSTQVLWSPTDGYLANGANEISIIQFRSDFNFSTSVTPDPTDFSVPSYSNPNFDGGRVVLLAIPEPMTLSLFGLGALGLIRRRRC